MAKRWPTVAELPELDDLPDPFVMRDGSRVKSRDDWRRRREEIAAMLAHYEYGHMPRPPGNVRASDVTATTVLKGKGVLRRAVLQMGPGHKVRMNVGIYLPANADGPVPVLMAVEPMWLDHLLPIAELVVKRGYGLAGYERHDLDPDDADRTNGVHPLYPDYDWASIAVWAWGAMRLVDYLETLPEVDAKRLALTGHSRAGKTALLAGALDERIALVAPHCSGAGGAGSYRIVGQKAETLRSITNRKRFHYWFHPRLGEFGRQEKRLPFDQHFLKALVAPRPVVSLEGLEDHWANPLGTQQMWRATQPVYDLLGASDKNVLYFRSGGHDTTIEDWKVALDYCDKFLLSKPVPKIETHLPFPDAPIPFRWPTPDKE